MSDADWNLEANETQGQIDLLGWNETTMMLRADKRGRVTIGTKFANKVVVITVIVRRNIK
jgi:hypothetical protein